MTAGRVLGHRAFQPTIVAGLMVFALFAMPSIFDATWIFNFTQMAIYSMVAASVGMLYGRVGLVSLGQVAPYGIGAWVTIRLAFATDIPYPLLLVSGGGVAGVAGGLFGAHVQWSIGVDQFNRQAALFLIAVVLMGGINSLWGALLAAFFAKILLDFLTQNVVGHQFWNDFALTIFGIGLMINLIQTTKSMENKGLLE